jgi:hypothetical protein
VTTLREGLCPPLVEPPADAVERLAAFLDAQSRIHVAAWMSHAHGADHDQHLLFGIEERDWRASDLVALEHGLEHDVVGFPAWLDLFSLADADVVREHGAVLWEQASPGADPLDYRFTYEPFLPTSAASGRFAARLDAVAAIRCVGATVQKLWNGDELVEERVQLFVDAPVPANVLEIAAGAARDTILTGRSNYACQLGRPRDGATILYEAAA